MRVAAPAVGEGWRKIMRLFPEHADAEFDWEGLKETHDIIYVVKRPAYELYLAVPRA
jgi:hypothetical protein